MIGPFPLVGRAAELAWLEGICENKSDGARIVEISGEPWMGKTRLLSELKERVSGRGWTVASGAADSLPPDLPFSVFTDALDDLLAVRGASVMERIAPSHARWLAGIFPSLAAGVPEAAVPADASDVHHACRAVQTLLQALDATGPLLLILDDVHWADDASLYLLRHLLRHSMAANTVIAVVHRPRQLNARLRKDFGEPWSTGHVHHLDLTALSEREAAALLPGDINEYRFDVLYHASGGNPGLLRALAALDDPAPEPHHEKAAALLANAPINLLREFRGLSAVGRVTLKSAALLPEPVDTGLLVEVTRLGMIETWTGIDELLNLDVVELDESTRTLRFRNPVVRLAAYQSAGAGWRLGMHAHTADALNRRKSPVWAIAPHLVKSIRAGEASGVRLLLDAAWTRLWQRPDQALQWAETALSIKKQVAQEDKGPAGVNGDEAPEPELLRAAATALTGRLFEGLTLLAAHRPATLKGRCAAALWRARILHLLGRHDEALDDLRRFSATVPDSAVEEHLELAIARATATLEIGGPVDPTDKEILREGRAWAGQAVVTHLLALLGLDEAARGDPEAAGKLVDEAQQLASELPDDAAAGRLESLYWLGKALSLLDRDKCALAQLERALTMAEQRRLHALEPRLAVELGELLLGSGDLAQAAYRASHAEYAARHSTGASQPAAVTRLRQQIARHDRRLASAGGDDDLGHAAAPENRPPESEDQAELDQLSTREMQIALLVSGGSTNRQIARSLGLSHKTVETYLARMFKKLSVYSRAQVAAMVGRSSGSDTGTAQAQSGEVPTFGEQAI
ncbi:AAA family ATPase [Nonomuraea sp. NPDC052116]|uniref:helix-turn-helix transcriptional regulator n=1 Tax=Nonomuraea sp. NPDC052116 TaxID=3155665 RepID=UPI003448175B